MIESDFYQQLPSHDQQPPTTQNYVDLNQIRNA